MKKFISKFISFIFLLSLLITLVSARYITLGHTVTMEQVIRGDKTAVDVTLVNSGDEPAYDVQLSLLLPEGINSEPIFLGKMDPDKSQSETFDIGIDSTVMPGGYSMVILTEYKDANGYPFSSVSPKAIIIKKIGSGQIHGMISELTLGDKETRKLTLELRNMDQKDHDIQIKLFGPKELKIDSEERPLMLNARGEAKMDYDISSFGALPGSSYVVFATLDYEEDGIHYSSTSSTSLGGIVKVVDQTKSTGLPGWLPLAALMVLVLIFVIYQFRK